MANTTLQEYLTFVNALTDQAGKIMEEGFYGAKKVEIKNGRPWDLVTDYDKKVEKIIIDSIKEKYPKHHVVAEEDSAEKGKKDHILTETPTWIIDPIDGTYNYVHGLPLTCISIGLAVDKEVVLGVVYNPLSHSKYSALKGQGAFLNGHPIHVSKKEGLKESLISFEISLLRVPHKQERNTKRYLELVKGTSGIRILGSAALSLCMVACGGLDGFFHEYLQPWDIAAGSLIIQEAGGYVCHINGAEFNPMGKDVLAVGNKKIAEDILEIFKAIQ